MATRIPEHWRRVVTVRLSTAELATARKAAAVNRQGLGAFLREAAAVAASECIEAAELRRAPRKAE